MVRAHDRNRCAKRSSPKTVGMGIREVAGRKLNLIVAFLPDVTPQIGRDNSKCSDMIEFGKKAQKRLTALAD